MPVGGNQPNRKGSQAMTRSLRSLFLFALIVAVTGCADSLKMYDQGTMMLQEHHIPPTWTKPGHTDYTHCRPDQLVKSDKWDMKVCPGTVDKEAYLAVQEQPVSGPSYVQMVVPNATSSVPLAAGIGAGLALSGDTVMQNASASQSFQPSGPWRHGYRH